MLSDGIKIYSINSKFSINSNLKKVDLYFKNIIVDGVDVISNTIAAEINSKVRIDLWINRINSDKRYRYLYKFKNSGSWTELPNYTNSILLNGFEPGKRTLLIKSEDIFTNEESLVKEIIIDVDQPYYLKWWFYLLTLLTVVQSHLVLSY